MLVSPLTQPPVCAAVPRSLPSTDQACATPPDTPYQTLLPHVGPPPPNPRSAVTTIKSNGRRSLRRISSHPLLSHRGRIGPPLLPVHFLSTGSHRPHQIWPEHHCCRHSSVSAAAHLIPFDSVQASPPSSSPDAIGTHWSTIAH
jgi:hypothetical protein